MRKGLKIGIIVLIAATIILAVVHLSAQENVECMVINGTIPVSFEDLNKVDFSGELVNGKGEVTSSTYRGVLLRELLESKGMDLSNATTITVTSADNYSAQFTVEEILNTDNIYAAIEADGEPIEGIDPGTAGVQIITFGDENSRRCVRYAAGVFIE